MWFLQDFQHFRLDAIGLLAILGESSIKATAKVCTRSKFCLLPRLLPAPHVLLDNERPRELESEAGKVVGIKSGNVQESIRYFAHLIHKKHWMGPDQDVETQQDHAQKNMRQFDEEKQNPFTQIGLFTSHREKAGGKCFVRCLEITVVSDKEVDPKSDSPLKVIEAGAFMITLALFALAGYYHDGWAILANVMLSGLSTLIGLTHRWEAGDELGKYNETGKVLPDGDLVVYYPKGLFYVIRCKEKVARELYLRPSHDLLYLMKPTRIYRILLQLGTLMLMVGVIALGNAQLILQTAFGASYLLLNSVYWTAGSEDPMTHWDLGRYAWTPVHFHKSEDKSGKKYDVFEEDGFTQGLWRAISIAGDANWARIAQIAPRTARWDAWLARAQKVVEDDATARSKASPTSTTTVSATSSPPDTPTTTSSAPNSKVQSLPYWDSVKVLRDVMRDPQLSDFHEL